MALLLSPFLVLCVSASHVTGKSETYLLTELYYILLNWPLYSTGKMGEMINTFMHVSH